MKSKLSIFLTILLLLLPLSSNYAQKFENLANTPQMGWNSWNKFGCNINEQLIKETADKMVELGLVDAGYIYLNLDDCWHGERDSLGFIHENKDKFPSGMKALSDYIHSKGMKMGIYSDAGRQTCGGYPGSFGHEYQDAIVYASWGVDYLKYDWCSTQDINPKGAYRLMRDALYSAGRPILFSMCEWGSNQPWLWASEVGHSWRTTGDICAHFDQDEDHGAWKSLSVMTILDLQEGLRQYAGPGHWNDPDMLEVGNGMSLNEDRAHFTMWCMLASPLLLGNDLTNMSDDVLKIITNKEMIAVNQDTLGIQGFRLRVSNGLETWLKPLSGGDWAISILNRNPEAESCTLDWNELCLTDDLSNRSTSFDEVVYTYKNLWNPQNVGSTADGVLTITVPGHDVAAYRLTPKERRITFSAVPHNNWIYFSPEKAEIPVAVFNRDNRNHSAKIALKLSTDKKEFIKNYTKTVKLAAKDSTTITFSLPLKPGFYEVELSIAGGKKQTFTIGFDPEKVISASDAQPDFKEFWDRTKKELAAVEPQYELTLIPERSTAECYIYLVKMKSLGGVQIQGIYAEPSKPGKYPVMINYMGYGSKPWYPGANPDMACFVLSTRGQGLDEPTNIYDKWDEYRLDDVNEYYYRGAYMDAVRAIDFVCSREKVDQNRIFAQGGSQGGALTLAACSLDDRICAAAPDVPFLNDFPDYFQIVGWPAWDIFEAQKTYSMSDEQVYKNLSYFDIKNLTGWIKCPILMAFGLQDKVCPPHTNFAGYNNITSEKEWIVYPTKGHNVWTETSWEVKRNEFFKKFNK